MIGRKIFSGHVTQHLKMYVMYRERGDFRTEIERLRTYRSEIERKKKYIKPLHYKLIVI